MKKKELLKTLDNASYYSLLVASVLILVYQFVGQVYWMTISVVLYGAAFLILTCLCVLKLIYIKNETKEDDVLLVDKAQESKPWLYVKLVFSAILFAFTVVFFVML